jgi:hypothetical protein
MSQKIARREIPQELLVRGRQYRLCRRGVDGDPQLLPYLTLEGGEFSTLEEAIHPISFKISPDVPVTVPGRVAQLISTSVALAEALKILYRDRELRHRALPSHLHNLAGDNDLIMSAVGFDFLIGRHLEYPMLLEAAGFGPEFVSSAIMADFFEIRPLEASLSAWWNNLILPVLGEDDSFYYVTTIGDFDFTREGEHHFLIPYLRGKGVQAEFGPAEDEQALSASTVYIRAGLLFPQVWERLSPLPLGKRITRGAVKVIPPPGNSFVSSKLILPVLADAEKLTAHGVPTRQIQLIERSLPSVFLYQPGMRGFLKEAVTPQTPLWLKGAWNYGGYGTRRVSYGWKIGRALQEIGAHGEMPIVAEEDVPAGYLPGTEDGKVPERRIEVRIRVFDHGEKIKAIPPVPSARVYLPGDNYPWDTILLDPGVIPQRR